MGYCKSGLSSLSLLLICVIFIASCSGQNNTKLQSSFCDCLDVPKLDKNVLIPCIAVELIPRFEFNKLMGLSKRVDKRIELEFFAKYVRSCEALFWYYENQVGHFKSSLDVDSALTLRDCNQIDKQVFSDGVYGFPAGTADSLIVKIEGSEWTLHDTINNKRILFKWTWVNNCDVESEFISSNDNYSSYFYGVDPKTKISILETKDGKMVRYINYLDHETTLDTLYRIGPIE